ncbi:hypothetical protein [Paenibacillus montanisoli]|uniref:50S ribosomal protein L33 n=1 Tax=Paenibacillus montanisoli TaxID=2081970 RepID=A0A328UA59_9BACL|nr:hypothetical protein [Paenibacillus montanisoli]RAP77114.1 hypothetical protein DL346_01005 [Paenibacillus montanisoli]
MQRVTKEQVQKMVGKTVYAVRKDGSVVTGKLVRAHHNQLQIMPLSNGKDAQTRAIIPLVLFDLLAIGLFAGGFGFGGFGHGGFGHGGFGCGGIGGFPGGHPGFGGDFGGCGCQQPFDGFKNTPFY